MTDAGTMAVARKCNQEAKGERPGSTGLSWGQSVNALLRDRRYAVSLREKRLSESSLRFFHHDVSSIVQRVNPWRVRDERK